MQDTTDTKVIFRRFKDGQVIALFPELPGTNNPWTCESYMQIGQHSAASTSLVQDTTPAKPKEYKDLYSELTNLGYRLKPVLRFTFKDYQTRRTELDRVLK